MYKFYNENPLGLFEDDCVIRSISCATGKSWDNVYDDLSDLAQHNGTMMDKKEFVEWFLDYNYPRVPYVPDKVWQLAEMYKDNIILCTLNSHILCIRFGTIYDTFNPSDKKVNDAWIVL